MTDARSGDSSRAKSGLLWATAFCTCASFQAQASTEVVPRTFEICAELGSDKDEVTARFTALGWQEGETEEAVKALLFWSIFARDYATHDDESLRRAGNSEDLGTGLGYLIVNSDFMSAPILGNSGLTPNQPGFILEPFRLAVLGVSVGKGYCVLSGPTSLMKDVSDSEGFVAQWPLDLTLSGRPGVDALFGEAGSARVFAAVFDQVELINIFSSMQIELPYTRKEFDLGIFDALPEAIVHISSNQSQ